MRIIDARVVVVGNPWKNWVFVRLATDEGVSGLGEATRGLGGLLQAPKAEAEQHPDSDTHFLRLYEPGWETRGRDQ